VIGGLDAVAVGELFGLPAGPASLTPVARGAVGRIWRLDAATGRYALKQLFGVPDLDAIGHEVAVTSHLAEAGVPLPRSRPARDGRIAVGTPAGWLRLYDWVDGHPVDLTDPALPGRLGRLLGSLHANALPPVGTVDPWYETAPDAATWRRLAGRAAADTAWGARLAASLDRIAELSALTGPMDPGSLVACHRDLHPENVLVTAGGSWVPLDWEDLGPAAPDHELAKLLLDWLVTDGTADPAAVTATLAAYRAAGGRGRLPDERAFGMAIAGDLNFLQRQATRALDPDTPREHRDHATMEIADSLDRLPDPALLVRLVALDADPAPR